MVSKQFRHGDVFLVEVPSLPKQVAAIPFDGDTILAYGEVTGHAHRIDARAKVSLWDAGAQRYLVVESESAPLTHEEHGRIDLPKGVYEVRIQRVYAPDAIRNVAD